MKILQINATYGYGSTGLIMKDIGDAAVQAGHEAYFAYQSANGGVEHGYAVGSWLDHKAHAVLCRIFGGQGDYSRVATKQLIRHIESIKPDVVHLHNLHSNFVHLNALLQYLGEHDIPTVITLHDCWFFTGKCFHYIDAGCDRFQTGCGNCPKKKAPPASLIFDRSAQNLADKDRYMHAIPRLKIVGCSQWICKEAKKGILQDLDISVIRNGVDTSVFKPYDKDAAKQALGLGDKFVIMGMANKWLQPANADAVNRIKASLEENDRILLVGCTDTQLRALKDENKIMAVGFIKSRESLARHYAAADVFLNITHADTLPTVNMESICCGTPVITYDSCGSPETVLPGCGYTVAKNDISGLLERIGELKKNRLQGVAETGIRNFDKNICYRDYIEAYEDLAKIDRRT